ncbi:armadillo-type protein [Mariannaea sp. PMI_226]|nr:armadillo-type protein [Mariannaea sp. PMI_226]
MASSLEDIASLIQNEGSSASADASDSAARQRRTELLAGVLETCQSAKQQGSPQLESIAKTLGDGSRDEAWRLPYGESGILGFFLQILAAEGISQGVLVHALRITGNSCADTEENRARVVEGNHILSIMRHLQNEKLIPYVIPVLFNILVDYEPAQKLASQSHLNKHLVSLLSSPSIQNFAPLITYFCKILSLLAQQDGEAAIASPLTVQVLLTLATSEPAASDVEDFISLVATAASYLANETFQLSLITDHHMDLLVTAFYNAQTQFDPEQIDDPETVTTLQQLCTSLLTTLADLSGNDAFPAHYPLDSSVPQSLLAWLRGAKPQLQAAACLALGNLSRSDEVSLALVQTHQAHIPLINLLSNPSATDSQQIYSALSFLKNLAIPAQNKPLLGEVLEATSVPRIMTIDTLPQVQFAAVSLARLLLVNCPPNAHRLCVPRSTDLSDEAAQHTSVHDILSLFSRSDAEPTKLEAARCISALCRVLHTTPVSPVLAEWVPSQDKEESLSPKPENISDDEKDSRVRALFYQNHELSKTLAFLVTQQKWPILRSEAWFVFALMARSQDGAAVIASTLVIPEVTDALSRAITGKAIDPESEEQQAKQIEATDSENLALPDGLGLQPQQVDPKQQANMAKVDRENCLVLCTEIVKKPSDNLTTPQLGLLQNLLKQGTELLQQENTASH